MMKRILLAGLLGGLALFLWEYVSHDLTPLGTAGMSRLQNEDAIRAVLQDKIPDTGLYYFPAPVLTPGMSAQQQQAAMARAMELEGTGPTGLMVFVRHYRTVMGKLLAKQFAADFAAMLLAAFLLAQCPSAGFLGRLLFVTALGLIPSLRAYVPMENWYGFPVAYVAAQTAIDVIGFAIGGLILAKLVQSRSKTIAAAA